MRETAHIIDIDTILLDGVTSLRPRELVVVIEREVQRVLASRRLSESIRVAGHHSVSTEIAQAVARSVATTEQKASRPAGSASME
jgi:hypothetical protein